MTEQIRGYQDVFKRQVEALALPGDLLIGISTSGNSPNILDAVRECRERELVTVGLTGTNGHKLKALCYTTVLLCSPAVHRGFRSRTS